MDVSVIIVNYNTLELTQKCIDSIVEQTKGLSYEIILVDNASSDGSIEFFNSDHRLMFIQSDVNLGFGKANNLGYSHSQGRFVFLLNSDTILLNNAIKYFHDAMIEQGDDVACLGGLLRSKQGDVINSYGDFPSINSMLRNLAVIYKLTPTRKANKNMWQTPIKVDFITGADLFIRREVIDRHGLFDPDFFMYFEETEMQWRYTRAGYQMKIISEPQILHLEGASLPTSNVKKSVRKDIIYFKSMFLFYKKIYGPCNYLLSRIVGFGFIPLFILKGYKCSDTLKMLRILLTPVQKHKIK